jgi:uncharacterized protein (DUF1499 family)
MKHLLKQLAILGAIGAAIWLATAWPRLDDVETGRTPEYPELQPHDYGAGIDSVVKSAKAVLARLPRWQVIGEGKGPAGAEIQAVHATPLLGFKDDVTIRFRRVKGRTVVTVRSRSRLGKWDFGQNARNISEFLEALDKEAF